MHLLMIHKFLVLDNGPIRHDIAMHDTLNFM